MGVNLLITVSILLLALIEDVKYKKINNLYFILIILTNLCFLQLNQLLIIILLSIFTFIILSILLNNNLGGGDIKILCSLFFYRINVAYLTLLISLLISIIYNKIIKKEKIIFEPFILIGFIFGEIICNYQNLK